MQHHSRRAGGYSVPSQPQTTGELTLPFWGTFLEEFHGICYVKLAEKKTALAFREAEPLPNNWMLSQLHNL